MQTDVDRSAPLFFLTSLPPSLLADLVLTSLPGLTLSPLLLRLPPLAESLSLSLDFLFFLSLPPLAPPFLLLPSLAGRRLSSTPTSVSSLVLLRCPATSSGTAMTLQHASAMANENEKKCKMTDDGVR